VHDEKSPYSIESGDYGWAPQPVGTNKTARHSLLHTVVRTVRSGLRKKAIGISRIASFSRLDRVSPAAESLASNEIAPAPISLPGDLPGSASFFRKFLDETQIAY